MDNTFQIGQTVECEPDENDSWHSFVGTVKSIRTDVHGNLIYAITDMDDESFDCFASQLSLVID